MIIAQWILASVLTVAVVGGCGPTATTPPGKQTDGQADHDRDEPTALTHESNHNDHSGWWCTEHGVPEEVCALCNSKVAAEFQKKGDWCQEHDRPDSQCFVCHPDLEGKFAAQYEAKYGQSPPQPQN